MNRQSSGHYDSSEDDGEEAEFQSEPPSIRKNFKEMLERKYDDDHDDDDTFSQTESE